MSSPSSFRPLPMPRLLQVIFSLGLLSFGTGFVAEYPRYHTISRQSLHVGRSVQSLMRVGTISYTCPKDELESVHALQDGEIGRVSRRLAMMDMVRMCVGGTVALTLLPSVANAVYGSDAKIADECPEISLPGTFSTTQLPLWLLSTTCSLCMRRVYSCSGNGHILCFSCCALFASCIYGNSDRKWVEELLSNINHTRLDNKIIFSVFSKRLYSICVLYGVQTVHTYSICANVHSRVTLCQFSKCMRFYFCK